MFRVQVEVAETPDGWVYSTHDFMGDEDCKLAIGMQSQGNRQIAFALTREATLRELYLDCLIKLSEDKDFLNRYVAASPEDKIKLEKQLATGATEIIAQTVANFAPKGAKGVLEMLAGSILTPLCFNSHP